jgi:UDP-2,3-diacylglucosamine pyrophosphatase LpxH
MTTKKEDIDMVDNAIYKLLFDIDKPSDGLTIREMTRIIWNYKADDPTTEQFYNRAKMLERRIGAIRHRIFEKIRKEMKEKGASKVNRPKFIPYALPVKNYWKYLNAASYEQMPWVIKGLRHKADGLNSNAEVLEAVF